MYLQETVYAIKRARRPLLQLSGGRDSLCALLLLIELGVDSFDVLWVDTGDAPHETLNTMAGIAARLGPRFHFVRSDSIKSRGEFGTPSSAIRAEDSQPHWKAANTEKNHVQAQYECCARNMMIPAHEFTVANGYDLVIRGNRASDTVRTPINHLSETPSPYILAYPIYDWSTEKVNTFLEERNCLPTFYKHMDSGVDCVTCPAFWGNGHQAWLEHYHPEKAVERRHQIEKLMSYMAHTIQLGFNELDSRSVTQ